MLEIPKDENKVAKAADENAKHFKFLTAIISGLFIQNVALFGFTLRDIGEGPISIYLALISLLLGFYFCFRYSSDSAEFYNGLLERDKLAETLSRYSKRISEYRKQGLNDEIEKNEAEKSTLEARAKSLDKRNDDLQETTGAQLKYVSWFIVAAVILQMSYFGSSFFADRDINTEKSMYCQCDGTNSD